MNFDKDGTVVSRFVAPAGSYEEYCARSGIPWNDKQRATREALWAWIAKNGQLGTASDNWTDEQWHEYNDLADEIQIADLQRRIDARANGWRDWPASVADRERRRAKR